MGQRKSKKPPGLTHTWGHLDIPGQVHHSAMKPLVGVRGARLTSKVSFIHSFIHQLFLNVLWVQNRPREAATRPGKEAAAMKVFLAQGSEILLHAESEPTTTNRAEPSAATEMPGRVWDPRKGRDVGPASPSSPLHK